MWVSIGTVSFTFELRRETRIQSHICLCSCFCRVHLWPVDHNRQFLYIYFAYVKKPVEHNRLFVYESHVLTYVLSFFTVVIQWNIYHYGLIFLDLLTSWEWFFFKQSLKPVTFYFNSIVLSSTDVFCSSYDFHVHCKRTGYFVNYLTYGQ